MNTLGMPTLIFNLGGEMLYILEQRLNAQAIRVDKSHQVVNDVVKTLFDEHLLEELFKPHVLYSQQSTRSIFDRLAHCSIMRLSEQSMDKLYDLMSMGVKQQLLKCLHPQHIIFITLNHCQYIKSLKLTDNVRALVDSAEAKYREYFKNLRVGDLFDMHHMLLQFFQDRRVKVSLFLQQSTQNPDGSFVLSPDTDTLPPGTVRPGTIVYADNGGREEKFPYRGTAVEMKDDYVVHLGENLYKNVQSGPVGDQPVSPTAAASVNTAAGPGAATAPLPATDAPPAAPAKEKPQADKNVQAEMNLLAKVIGDLSVNKEEVVHLALFPGDEGLDTEHDHTAAAFVVQQVDATLNMMDHNPKLVSVLSDLDVGADDGMTQEEKDLLDMI